MAKDLPVPSNTVVPKIEPLDEEQFHDAMMLAIAGQVAKRGKAKVAGALGVTVRQLSNLGNGSFPRVDRIYNLRTLDPDALDPIDRKQGVRSVPRDAICSTDPVSTKLARLLTRTIDAERPDSPGGPAVTLREVMGLDEDDLRAAARSLVAWVEMIDAYRAGEAPRLRVAK